MCVFYTERSLYLSCLASPSSWIDRMRKSIAACEKIWHGRKKLKSDEVMSQWIRELHTDSHTQIFDQIIFIQNHLGHANLMSHTSVFIDDSANNSNHIHVAIFFIIWSICMNSENSSSISTLFTLSEVALIWIFHLNIRPNIPFWST